jgi:hypothetical protein
MNEQEKIKLADIGLRILDIQINPYILKMTIRILDLLEINNNPTILDVINLKRNQNE